MADTTPAQIIADAPLGALVRFRNGEAAPPARFKKKLATWENHNGLGTLVEVNAEHGSFTLHMGDMSSGAVIVMRVYRTYMADSALAFAIEREPEVGAILCGNVFRGRFGKVDKVAPDEGSARRWLANNVHFGELRRIDGPGRYTVLHAAREAA